MIDIGEFIETNRYMMFQWLWNHAVSNTITHASKVHLRNLAFPFHNIRKGGGNPAESLAKNATDGGVCMMGQVAFVQTKLVYVIAFFHEWTNI